MPRRPRRSARTPKDADGTIAAYLFDLDGDGTYELDSDGIAEATTTFSDARAPHDRRPGARRLGRRRVRELDRQRHAPLPADRRPPLSSFRLNTTSLRRRGQAHAGDHLPPAREGARGGQAAPRRRGGQAVRLIERGVRTPQPLPPDPRGPSHLQAGALRGADLRAGRVGQAAGRAALGAAPLTASARRVAGARPDSDQVPSTGSGPSGEARLLGEAPLLALHDHATAVEPLVRVERPEAHEVDAVAQRACPCSRARSR